MNTLCRPVLILFCLLLFPVLSHGAVRYASPTGVSSGNCNSWGNACTLQRSLTIAGSGDEIWVKAGTHKPTTGKDRAATFQLVSNVAIYGGFKGTETARDLRNVAANVTTLSGDIGVQGDATDNSYHVVTAYVGQTDVTNAILDGVTISGGYADTGLSDGGGLICRYGSSLTLANCTFDGNYASSSAGGLYYDGSGSLTVTNCIFSNNSAPTGGGLYTVASGSLTLTNCSFSGNSAYNGGGIFQNSISGSNSRLTMVNCIVNNNSASHSGGGVYVTNGSILTMTNGVFSNNSAGSSGGGGLFVANSSSADLTNCTFSGNSADSGGGIYAPGTTSTNLTNCTFRGNSAAASGGAMFTGSGNSLTNCTFSGNSAPNIAGLFASGSSSAVVRNSIFWDSSESFGTATVTNSIVKGGHAGTGNLDADPLLEPLGDYGGGVPTMALLPGSPAIDAGDNTVCPATDQRGMARPQLGGCDIGAFEFRGFYLNIDMAGPGTVTSQNQNGTNYACTKSAGGPCKPERFADGDTVSLTATGSNSTFSSWTGDVNSSDNPYTTLLMDADKAVTATFTPDPATVMIDGDATRYYSLGTALGIPTQDDVTIRARNLDFGESIDFTNGHSLRLRGGFTDAAFTDISQTGYTTISGSLRIVNGLLKVDRVTIKP